MSKSVLVIISGSIAAYKALDVIRRLRERGVRTTAILTRGGAEFITPLSVAAISGEAVYGDLFSLKDEHEMGHIRLAREHDVIAVIPASADIIAKMAAGMADDLATATLLAADNPVLVAPAMNARMWAHPATRRNVGTLRGDGVCFVEPEEGELACGETGAGRLADTDVIVSRLLSMLEDVHHAQSASLPLAGLSAIVTGGPTYEAIDPVRFIGNRSSGKQGIAIAEALRAAGAEVTLIAGPVTAPLPSGIRTVRVETAEAMLKACMSALPADIAVCCAAVCDWRVKAPFASKLKKRANATAPALDLVLNPDILYAIASAQSGRPKLVVGFAAETDDVVKNAAAKLQAKACDWMIANDVAGGKIFGGDDTDAYFIAPGHEEAWGKLAKQQLAIKLVEKIIAYLR